MKHLMREGVSLDGAGDALRRLNHSLSFYLSPSFYLSVFKGTVSDSEDIVAGKNVRRAVQLLIWLLLLLQLLLPVFAGTVSGSEDIVANPMGKNVRRAV